MSDKTPDDGTQDPYAQSGYPPPPGPAQPPVYGQSAQGQQPGYGQQPPAYGQPAAGQQPPAYGQPAPGQPSGWEKTTPEQPAYGAQDQYSTGGYPPPGSAYPPPSAPPISAGQYGAPESPVPDGFRYGWQKFTQNIGAFLLAALAYIVAFSVIGGIFFAVLVGSSLSADDGDIGAAGLAGLGFGAIVFTLIMFLLVFLAQAGIIRGALAITQGRRPSLADFFAVDRIGTVILTSLLISIVSTIVSFTFIGSIIVAFFGQFALFFIIDKGLGVIDSIKASIRLVLDNLSTAILLYVFVYLANAVGAILLLVGLLVAIPVSMIASAYVYRKLINEQPV